MQRSDDETWWILLPRDSQVSTVLLITNNNPIRFIDPDGRDWVESSNGEITWSDDLTSDNYKNERVFKKGETYRATFYERARVWDNKK